MGDTSYGVRADHYSRYATVSRHFEQFRFGFSRRDGRWSERYGVDPWLLYLLMQLEILFHLGRWYLVPFAPANKIERQFKATWLFLTIIASW